MEAPEKAALERYFKGVFKGCSLRILRRLGRGVHGAGYLVTLDTTQGRKSYVIKGISPEGLGHDYPSDRAGMLLLALNNYNKLPSHVKALDVLSLQKDGAFLKSIGGGTEYFLLMEHVKGKSYFNDLEGFSKKKRLSPDDKKKIILMAEYLNKIHSLKKESKTLYLRKLRDIIGHGECLMGVFDTYPEGVLSHREMAGIEKKCIDWRARLKSRYKRLSMIHGDFHPGNIWFRGYEPLRKRGAAAVRGKGERNPSFILLDRSRGEWGEPADDITALAINYIFFSIKHFNKVKGAYLEGFRLFFDRYIEMTGDEEVLEVLAPFFAFRGAVVANPVFYPELTKGQRKMIFGFVNRVLDGRRFAPENVNDYIRII